MGRSFVVCFNGEGCNVGQRNEKNVFKPFIDVPLFLLDVCIVPAAATTKETPALAATPVKGQGADLLTSMFFGSDRGSDGKAAPASSAVDPADKADSDKSGGGFFEKVAERLGLKHSDDESEPPPSATT